MSKFLQRVVFLHRAGHQSSGSKIMRCDQLCEIAQRHLGDRYDFSVRAMPRPYQHGKQRKMAEELQGALVIMLKRAHNVLSQDNREYLSEKAKAVIIDYVDAPTDAEAAEFADVHVAASPPAQDRLKRRVSRLTSRTDFLVRTLTHHADPRITYQDRRQDKELRAIYLGLSSNTVIPEEIAPLISRPDYDNDLDFKSALGHLSAANLHFGVRPQAHNRAAMKPFTKGFNAAAAGANILVNRQTDAAEFYLGSDYPFLVDSNSAEDIANGIHLVRDSLGTDVWRGALDRMDNLREKIQPAVIAAELDQILQLGTQIGG